MGRLHRDALRLRSGQPATNENLCGTPLGTAKPCTVAVIGPVIARQSLRAACHHHLNRGRF
jgi:hypothetical protein